MSSCHLSLTVTILHLFIYYKKYSCDLPLHLRVFSCWYLSKMPRVLINSSSTDRRCLITAPRATIHISLTNVCHGMGWSPLNSRIVFFRPGRSSASDLYRPSVNWILKCKWLSLVVWPGGGDSEVVDRDGGSFQAVIALQCWRTLLFFYTTLVRMRLGSQQATIFLVTPQQHLNVYR